MNSTKLVFGRHAACPKCGTPRDQGDFRMPSFGAYGRSDAHDGGGRPDDWKCPNDSCINHHKLVFGKHTSCPSCGTAKDADRAGDWQCPNAACQNHSRNVFGRKSSCPKCGAARPSKGQGLPMPFARPAFGMPNGPMMYGMQSPMGRMPMANPMEMMMSPRMGAMRDMMFGGGKGGMPKGGLPKGGKGGLPKGLSQSHDWRCPNLECMNSSQGVFGRHDSCPKCGAAKASLNPGDWKCPNTDCLNHFKLVFAKHLSCPKCGAEHPGEAARERSRSPR